MKASAPSVSASKSSERPVWITEAYGNPRANYLRPNCTSLRTAFPRRPAHAQKPRPCRHQRCSTGIRKAKAATGHPLRRAQQKSRLPGRSRPRSKTECVSHRAFCLALRRNSFLLLLVGPRLRRAARQLRRNRPDQSVERLCRDESRRGKDRPRQSASHRHPHFVEWRHFPDRRPRFQRRDATRVAAWPILETVHRRISLPHSRSRHRELSGNLPPAASRVFITSPAANGSRGGKSASCSPPAGLNSTRSSNAPHSKSITARLARRIHRSTAPKVKSS